MRPSERVLPRKDLQHPFGRSANVDRGRGRDHNRGRGPCPSGGRGPGGPCRHPSSHRRTAHHRDEPEPSAHRNKEDGSSSLHATDTFHPPHTSSRRPRDSPDRELRDEPSALAAAAALQFELRSKPVRKANHRPGTAAPTFSFSSAILVPLESASAQSTLLFRICYYRELGRLACAVA